MAIEILPWREEHHDGVRDLIVPIQQDGFGIPITYADQPDLHDVAGFYRKGAGEFWVAADGGKVVGSIALVDIGSGQAALGKMFVMPDYRGREHGVAGRLLTTLLDHARGSGIREVYLGTTAAFVAAHRFYEKAGFALVEEADLPPRFPRMGVDTRFYRIGLF